MLVESIQLETYLHFLWLKVTLEGANYQLMNDYWSDIFP